MSNRIKIGVGGRFHADRLATALMEKGWKVSVVTSLPKSRFKGVPSKIIETALLPEVIYRLATKWASAWAADYKMEKFGKAFSRSCKRDKDLCVILAWSGFAVEAFRENPKSFKVLVRDSTHILEQVRVLKKEYESLGFAFPNHHKVIERELEEYKLADKIIILSKGAKRSFLEQGIPENKLALVRLGADLALFESADRPKNRTGPLQVVYFGTIGVRKGVIYLLEALEKFSQEQVRLTCIGAVEPEMKKLLRKYSGVKILPPLPHKELAKLLRGFDVFVMPTVEDGFGLVIPQAMAAGLVPIVSEAAGASDLITNGKNGLLVPPRDTDAIVQSLTELLTHPNRLDEIRANIKQTSSLLSWDHYGQDFDTILRDGIEKLAG